MENMSRMSMWINDTGWSHSLRNYVHQDVRECDTVMLLSASGALTSSSNLIQAARLARDIGASTYCVTFDPALPLPQQCDHPLVIPHATEPELYEVATVALFHQLRLFCEQEAATE
jgi:DNA-binding MurR/RpiR family transcriptional regulator